MTICFYGALQECQENAFIFFQTSDLSPKAKDEVEQFSDSDFHPEEKHLNWTILVVLNTKWFSLFYTYGKAYEDWKVMDCPLGEYT